VYPDVQLSSEARTKKKEKSQILSQKCAEKSLVHPTTKKERLAMSLSKLQTLTTFWSSFGLPSLQSSLDEVAAEITAREDEADEGRKALIQQGRDSQISKNYS
jgi:hypothetical protein